MTTCNAQGYPARLQILAQQLPSRYMPRAASASDVRPPLLPPPDRGMPPPPLPDCMPPPPLPDGMQPSPPPDGMPPPPPSEGGQTPPPPPDGGGRRERSTARAESSGPPPDQDSCGGRRRRRLRRKGDVESLIMRWRRRPRSRGNRLDSCEEGFFHAPSAPDAPSYPTGVGLVSSTGGHPAGWRWKNGGRDGRMPALAQQDAYHFPSTSEKSDPR